MTDQNPDVIPLRDMPVETQPDGNPAHPVDEDPEEHIGDELKDPWGDGSNRDWATVEEDTKEVSE
jgi:hypothetical protein